MITPRLSTRRREPLCRCQETRLGAGRHHPIRTKERRGPGRGSCPGPSWSSSCSTRRPRPSSVWSPRPARARPRSRPSGPRGRGIGSPGSRSTGATRECSRPWPRPASRCWAPCSRGSRPPSRRWPRRSRWSWTTSVRLPAGSQLVLASRRMPPGRCRCQAGRRGPDGGAPSDRGVAGRAVPGRARRQGRRRAAGRVQPHRGRPVHGRLPAVGAAGAPPAGAGGVPDPHGGAGAPFGAAV
jgi:hypothetical protein